MPEDLSAFLRVAHVELTCHVDGSAHIRLTDSGQHLELAPGQLHIIGMLARLVDTKS
jgi:hypothetical protein